MLTLTLTDSGYLAGKSPFYEHNHEQFYNYISFYFSVKDFYGLESETRCEFNSLQHKKFSFLKTLCLIYASHYL